jgi:hypothetical protein
MKIDKMNKSNAKLVREILQSDLAPILAQYGLKMELGNAGYDSDSVKFNGFVISLDTALSKESKALTEELAWRERMGAHQLDATKIRKEGKKYAFVLSGYRARATKKPFIVNCLNGNGEYTIAPHTALNWFGVKA